MKKGGLRCEVGASIEYLRAWRKVCCSRRDRGGAQDACVRAGFLSLESGGPANGWVWGRVDWMGRGWVWQRLFSFKRYSDEFTNRLLLTGQGSDIKAWALIQRLWLSQGDLDSQRLALIERPGLSQKGQAYHRKAAASHTEIRPIQVDLVVSYLGREPLTEIQSLAQTCNLSRMHRYYPCKKFIFLGNFLL